MFELAQTDLRLVQQELSGLQQTLTQVTSRGKQVQQEILEREALNASLRSAISDRRVEVTRLRLQLQKEEHELELLVSNTQALCEYLDHGLPGEVLQRLATRRQELTGEAEELEERKREEEERRLQEERKAAAAREEDWSTRRTTVNASPARVAEADEELAVQSLMRSPDLDFLSDALSLD